MGLGRGHKVDKVLSLFETALMGKEVAALRDKMTRDNNGAYPYIPLGIEQFLVELEAAMGLLDTADYTNGKSFIDVGCGVGTKVAFANAYGFKATGVEINLEYVKVARTLLPDLSIIHMDARELDYSSFDVIYFYCPMHNHEFELALEKQIYTTAKKGVIILANLKHTREEDLKEMGIEQVFRTPSSGTIYRKV